MFISKGKPGKARKAIGLLISVLMVLSILSFAIPNAYADDQSQPSETSQPTETAQPSDTPEPTETTQPAETAQPSDTPDTPKSTDTPQATEEPQASVLQPAENTQPNEKYTAGEFKKPKTSGQPDKSLLSAAEKKLSTKLLQLSDNENIPSGITRDELVSQMAKQKQIKQGNAAADVPGTSGTSVHVYIKTKKGSDLKSLSKYAKIEDTDEESGLISAWVDTSMIKSVASLKSVKNICEVLPPYVREGSELSEGDAMLNADDLRALTGADGTGVKVGIISNGVDNLSSAVSSGDLPGGANAVHVLSNTVGGDEGTAMLEIVHDLAPGAELYFHDCGDSTIAFNSAVNELAQSGCNVICDDIGWIAEPFFEDGSVAQNVSEVMNKYGLIYVSSAGNAAKNHYQGAFVDLGKDDLFGDGCPTADFSGGKDPDHPFLYVQVPANSSMIVVMEWNDPFGNSTNDYELELYDTESKKLVDGSYDVQNGSGSDPIEGIVYYNDSSDAQNITIRAFKSKDPDNNSVAADKILEIYTYGCYTYPTNTVSADSIFGHPAVPGVLSCGAIDGNSEDSDYGQIEDFSSQGPVTMISGTRQKPDICGIDGVSVTGAGGFPDPFYGTSASAPHIAAVAALVKSVLPTESSSNIRKIILDNGVDLGSSGYDNTYGYGRADALAAIQNSSFKVTFDSQGGSAVNTQRVLKGGIVNKPLNPSKTDYVFAGWYKEQECINAWNFAEDTVTSDTTIYAKWKNSRDSFTISKDGTYDISDYGQYSQIIINTGLNVTLTNSSLLTSDIQISGGEGISLTINNLIIQCSDEGALSFAGSGNSLILVGENTLKSGPGKPGIKVEEGTSLEISGEGSVLSVSGSNAAGIGGGNGCNGGQVAVKGGTVYAWGTDSTYDIGGGKGGTGGTLSISGDSAVLLAGGTSPDPVTSTHEIFTTNIVQSNIVFGKIKLPEGWPKPIHAYLNSGAISTLTYDSNGGSGTVPDAVVQYTGTSVKLSKGTGLSKNFFPAASWNTQADGLGTSYSLNADYKLSGDITLYAVYAIFQLTTYNAFDNLGFTPMDTAIDPDRDVVYMTESGGDRLYRVDLATGKIGYLEFPYKAERLTVKNDKIYVTLPHGSHDPYDDTNGSGSIAVVDAAAFSVDRMFDEVPDPYDIEVDDAGRVYIGSGSDQWSILTVYDTKTGQKIDSVGSEALSLLDFNTVYNKLYSIDTNLYPINITAYEITNGDITTYYSSTDHKKYPMSTYIKVSPDGKYIFNGSGNIFNCSPKQTGDMTYAGNIGMNFDSVCFDQSNDEFIIANDNGMYIYDYDTWKEKAAQGSKDYYKGVYCNNDHFVSMMMEPSTGKYYLVLDNKTPGLDVTGVTLNQNSLVIMDDETETLTETISPKYATNQDVTWSSSNTSVATVSNGVITGVGGGSAVITVTTKQGGLKDTCNLTVIPYKDYSAFNELWFTPLDTANDPGRSVIYMTETGGNKLYRIDLNTGKINYIKFPYKAEQLTVKNGKIYVTLPHGKHDPYDFTNGSGSISVVDAATFSVDKTFDEVPDPYDIEVDDSGRAYIGSGSGQWSILTVYDTKTGQQVDSVGLYSDRSLLDFNTVYNKLYSIDTDSSPRNIKAYEITDGNITTSYNSPYHGDYAMSTYMKISPDGKYIFNGSGNIFNCAPNKTGDMVYAGTLGSAYTSVCFDLADNRFYTVNGDAGIANSINLYAYDTKTLVGSIPSKDLVVNVQNKGDKIYTLQRKIDNGAFGNYYVKQYAADALLSSISMDGAEVSDFDPSITDYNIAIPVYKNTINIAVNTFDTNGRISGDTGSLPIKIGQNTYTITITGTVSGLTKTYTLHVMGIDPSDANLSAINLSSGTLSPAFTADTLEYSVALPDAISYTTISAAKASSAATLNIDGTIRTSETISLYAGQTKNVVIKVTAQDGVTTKTYTLHITKPEVNKYSIIVFSNNASYGTVTGGGTYDAGAIVTLTAYARPGYAFYRWMEADTEVSTNAVYTFISTGDRTIKAIFGSATTPASITAEPTGYNSISISWSAVAGASGYELSRSTALNGTYKVIKNTTSKSYQDTGLASGTAYYYKVRAYSASGKSKVYGDYSPIASAQPVLSSVAAATAIAYGPTSAKVSWNSVSGRTMYEVWRSTSPDSAFTLVGTTKNTYFKDTTLVPFVTYYYQVRVYRNVNRHKVYSASASPTVSTSTTLDNVTGVTAKTSSASSIKISWSSVYGCSGYEVLRSASPDGDYITVKSTSSNSFTDTKLIPNNTYFYKVVAYRKAGSNRVYSTQSSPVSSAPYFGSVKNLKAVRKSAASIKLTWNSVAGRTGYEIYRSINSDSDYVLIKSVTGTNFTDTRLTTGVTYYYKIMAYMTLKGVRYRSGETSVVSATP